MQNPPPNTVVVRENEVIRLPPHLDHAAVRERILRAASGYPFEVVKQTRRGLKAGPVVGVLTAGQVQIDIYPKSSEKPDRAQDARFLMDLLAFSGRLPVRSVNRADVALTSAPLLDVIIQAFARDTFRLLAEGVPRRYASVSESSSVVRGRIDFARLVRQGPWSAHVVPVTHAPLQRDNPLSQLLLATLDHVKGRARSMTTRALVDRCISSLDGVEYRPLSEDLVSRVQLSRYEKRWEGAVEFARALVGNRSPSAVSSGRLRFRGLIFPLERLFEESLRRLLRDALRPDFGLRTRDHRHLLRAPATGKTHLKMKPDFVFEASEATPLPSFVGDAKWKRLHTKSATRGLKSGDAYQMNAYLSRYGMSRGVLFYPEVEWMRRGGGKGWSTEFEVLEADHRMALVGVDIRGLVDSSRPARAAALTRLKGHLLSALA